MTSFHDGNKWHKNDTVLFVRSMGKTFPVMAVTVTVDAVDDYCARHDSAAVMASVGGLNILCSVFAGEVAR